MKDKVELGDRVRDRVTGLSGIVYGITDWLNGCQRISIQPEEIKDGKPVEMSVIDVQDIIIINKQVHTPAILIESEPEKRKAGLRPNVSKY
jgi:hypothetical protein